MADILKANSFQTVVSNTIEKVFQSPASSAGTLLTAVTAANDGTGPFEYSLFIGPETPTIPIRPTREIRSKKTDIPPEVSGHVVPSGQWLWLKTNVSGTIALTVTGRDLS